MYYLLKCYVMQSVMRADLISCLKLLEIWDFGLALASRQMSALFILN